MREFKSGTLKSGGSGKKVTNPKQAIAIALSEANAMNQGGMMQNPVMQRPMFQTPMQRESMGIMAGVAPIRGYAEGGEAEDSLGSELFRLLVVDVNDPVDVAISSAAAGMAATGIGGPAAALAKLAGTGRKLFRGADAAAKAAAKAEEKVKKMEQAGLFRKSASKAGEKVGRFAAEKEVMTFGSDPVGYFTEDMAEGGIASLQPVGMNLGGLMTLLQRFGPSILKRIKKKDKPKKETKKKESKKKEDKEPESPDMPITEGRTGTGSKIGQGIKETGKYIVKQAPGVGAGYYGSEFFRDPETGEIVEEKVEEASQPSQVITQTQTSGAGNQIEDTEEEGGGVTDFLSRAVSKLQDPRLQYQLARAAQPSEGFTPRNFFSDVTLAGQEYDDMKAKRDYLAAQTRAQEDKTTDLERLADTFLSTVDLSGLSETQIQEEKEKILLSLYNTQQQSAKTAQLMELLSTLGTSEQALEALRKFTESGGSTESIADILSSIRARQQSI